MCTVHNYAYKPEPAKANEQTSKNRISYKNLYVKYLYESCTYTIRELFGFDAMYNV